MFSSLLSWILQSRIQNPPHFHPFLLWFFYFLFSESRCISGWWSCLFRCSVMTRDDTKTCLFCFVFVMLIICLGFVGANSSRSCWHSILIVYVVMLLMNLFGDTKMMFLNNLPIHTFVLCLFCESVILVLSVWDELMLRCSGSCLWYFWRIGQ